MFQILLIIPFAGLVYSANLPNSLPNNSSYIDKCDVPCTLEVSQLICTFDGENYKLFDSECDYNKQNCRNPENKKLTKIPVTECLMRTINGDNCNFPCPNIDNPICGYDGETYKSFSNGCLMIKQACNQRRVWRLSEMDNCKNLNKLPEKCPELCPLNYDPVCGYDGLNYTVFSNQCNLNLAHCKNNSKWKQVRLSTCNAKLNITLDTTVDEIIDNCPKYCTKILFPVCGSDGEKKKIFANECMLKIEQCEKNQKWHRIMMSNCLFRA